MFGATCHNLLASADATLHFAALADRVEQPVRALQAAAGQGVQSSAWHAAGPVVASMGLGVALGFGLGGVLGRAVARHRMARVSQRLATEPVCRLERQMDKRGRRVFLPVVRRLACAVKDAADAQAELEDLRSQIDQRIYEQTRRACAKLTRLSLTDELTGLRNRRGFEAAFERRFHKATTAQLELAVLAIDLDKFKQLNDTCGHAMGDRALIAAASVARRAIRRGDLAARVGGDELMIVLVGVNADHACKVAHRLIWSFSRGGQAHEPTVPWPGLSVGVAMRELHEARSARELREMADAALYQSKRSGREMVTLWSPSCRFMPPREAA